jgi:hypothetical protein
MTWLLVLPSLAPRSDGRPRRGHSPPNAGRVTPSATYDRGGTHMVAGDLERQAQRDPCERRPARPGA